MKIVMDSDCLIKITKTGLKETVCEQFCVVIPQLVKHETVDCGTCHADAGVIAENIARCLLEVREDSSQHDKGEHAVLKAFSEGGYDAICSDDRKFLTALRAASVPHATPAVLLCLMVGREIISRKQGAGFLERLRPYISADEYTIARLKIESY